MANVVGLIPAAGRGIRAYPYTELVPKCLLEVDGVPLLRRNLELMRDQLGIREVVVVIGHHGERIREYLGDGSRLGLQVRIVENDDLDRDFAYSIYLGAREIDGPCCVLLSDEFYMDTNHGDLLRPEFESAEVVCGLIESDSVQHVRKNYSVELHDGEIRALVEKPMDVVDRWMGVGTYWLGEDAVRSLVERFERDTTRAPVQWTGWIDGLARSGKRVLPLRLHGQYVNVNDREALNSANLVARNHGFEARTVSLVYLVDEDAPDTLEESILRFADSDTLDEVVVAARSESETLAEVARHAKVRLLVRGEPGVGIGTLLTDGLDAARGDILITAYSDDTFSPRDLDKLLVYVRDADLVVGTRTTRQMIEQGSNMRGIVRAAHIGLAKLLEVLWWRFDSRFTDVGCVYRALWRSTYQAIRGELRCTGVEVFAEMMIEVLRARRRVIEIPVNYYNRARTRTHVRSRYQTIGTFVRILSLMLRKRVAPRPAALTERAPAVRASGDG
ncbi:MAG: NTP transferase domain-containing protein [Myxococcota bacterium]